MKKIITFLVFLVVLACSTAVFADYQTVDVYINDEILVAEAPAVLVGERTMVPLRAISEKLGCTVGWDGQTQTAEIKNSKTAVYVTIDSDVMVKKNLSDGKSEKIKIDAPAMLYKSRTLIPLRAVSEALEATVEWDIEKECAIIKTSIIGRYYGIITEKNYISEELGIKFTAPEGTEIFYEQEQVEVTDWTDDITTLDFQTVMEFGANNEETGTNVMYAVSPRTSISPEECLPYVKWTLENEGGETLYVSDGKMYSAKIAGYDFKYFKFTANTMGMKLNMNYYASEIDGRLVFVIAIYADGEKESMENFINAFERI